MRQAGKFHCGVEAWRGLTSDGRETLSRLSGKLQDVGQRWVFDLGSVLPCKDLGPNHTCCIGISIHSRCLEVVCRGFELEHRVDTISWKHPIQWALHLVDPPPVFGVPSHIPHPIQGQWVLSLKNTPSCDLQMPD